MLLLSHPTGNVFVKELLCGLEQAGQLAAFHTTIAYKASRQLLNICPPALKNELLRRKYPLDESRVICHPWRELMRLSAARLGVKFLLEHEVGYASVDAIYKDLDGAVASYIRSDVSQANKLTAVYAYEDGALATFRAAQWAGLACYYDLPIAYWQTSRKLLEEEAERLPEWEATLVGNKDSEQKLARKSEEIDLADTIVCPSEFVQASIPESIRQKKRCIVARFGSPVNALGHDDTAGNDKRLRVLFAGSMTQRKGLADLFAAVKLLAPGNVELIVMGSPVAPMDFYRRQYADFTYESSRPHQAVLQLMRRCDILVLPSIVEGRALVQQEALSCGLPIIVTANAGGEDLVETGKTGFLVPIRSPHLIAEKINWFLENRGTLKEMRRLAREKAAQVSWDNYRSTILSAIDGKK